jgi:PKHD-type hydroxylase
MFLEVQDVLSGVEVEQLGRIAETMPFVDGRISNPANQTKLNQQADTQSPLHLQSSSIVQDALLRSRAFQAFAFPQRIAPPLLARYRAGMKYGAHFDTAFVAMPDGMLRTDLSVTVFLSDPKSYEGGELAVHMGARTVLFKGAPGAAVIYPSTTLHEVAPVRSGERLVAITFVQSKVADEAQRALLYELKDVTELEGLKLDWASRIRLQGVYQNLLRQWAND